MNVYGELTRGQLENLSANPSAGLIARVYFNTVSNKVQLDNGTLIRSLLVNDAYLVIGNNGTASSNVRINRSAASTLQFLLGDDVTAEGSATAGALAGIQAKLGGSQVDASLVWSQIATPSNPAANKNLLYFKSDDNLYLKTSGGVETKVSVIGITQTYRAASTTDTILTTDDVVIYDATGGAFNADLPAAATAGTKVYTLQKSDTSFNAVTVRRAGSDTIDGGTSTTLNTAGESIRIISDGVSNWVILDRRASKKSVVFTMTVNGVSSNPTKTTSPAVDLASWSRSGNGIRILYTYQPGATTGSAAGNGVYLFKLPTGLSADTTYVTVGSGQNDGVVGSAMVGTNALNLWGAAKLYDSTSIIIEVGTDNTSKSQIGSAFQPMTTASLTYSFSCWIPISGWNA